ncbi:MAG: hypothetical protein LBF97_03280 [Elusimicrobiota bacterium]|jgi:hypothetical protein|nr:hypothetical protein [Elusimicrobiota bacterium]
MEIWNEYNLINLNDFENMNIPYFQFSRNLENLGNKDFRVFKGFGLYSILVDNVLLIPYLNGKNGIANPTRTLGAYIDENNNLWIGYKQEE